MFYLRREREERASGKSERAALEAAAATSGRSVLISGLTVMVAMAGMFLTGDATFASFGLATMMVVAIAMLGSLTVLPALLSRLGDGVDRLQVPLVGRLRRDDGQGRIWGAVVDRVLQRPVLSAVLSAGFLLLLALPALQFRIADPGTDSYPQSMEIVKAYNRMQDAFPGTALPANIVVKAANVNAPAVRGAIADLKREALASGRAQNPITVDTSPDSTVANITMPIVGNGTDSEATKSLALLRDSLIPETVGSVPGTQAGVTGLTAQWKDASEQMKAKLPLVVGFVLLFAFLLMLVAFRSIVVAAKAIVLNLLSVAAAYGVLVLVFQHGYGKGIIGFDVNVGHRPRRAAAAVRDPVRALDGLPRVRHQQDPRVVQSQRLDGRRDLRGHQVDRGRRDERGARHGRGVRDLRDALDHDVQAVRRRARRRDPDRRHDRPRRAAPRDDEAAR